MRWFSRNSLAPLLAVLAAASLLLASAIYMINERSIETLILNNARKTSQAWTEEFGNRIADIEHIANGGMPSPASLDAIKQARWTGHVYRFKLFNADGVSRLDSDKPIDSTVAAERLAEHKPAALDAAKAGQAFVEVKNKELLGETRLVAETYVPVMKDGRRIAIIEVYVDQTHNAAQFREAFSYNSMLIALLATLGFAIPALGFYRRTHQKMKADAQAAFLASHDALTELVNRRSLAGILGRKLADASAENKLTAVRVIDIDHFNDINGQYGAEAGDELLRAIASRLSDLLCSNDVAARLGSDEFLLAQTGFENEAQIEAGSEIIANALAVPFRTREGEIYVTFSIGLAVAPADGRHAEQLIANAGTAARMVKFRGRNGECRFEPAFDTEMRKRIEIEMLVREATQSKGFELHFQPLFDIASTELKGFEALLRMRNARGEFVPPDVFIPIAEEIGLIDEIGAWVLEAACSTAVTWPSDAKISVNLSAAQFRRHTVCEATRHALISSGLNPARLNLEITESLLLADHEHVLAQLRELKGMGVSIVMDDFGSGYSSLGYMLKFPFDHIKIDRAFIHGLSANDEDSRTLVETIIALGHTLKMTVTAEGVETLSQAQALREMNCDDAQGYLFGRPVPATEVAGIFMRQFAGEIKKASPRHARVA